VGYTYFCSYHLDCRKVDVAVTLCYAKVGVSLFLGSVLLEGGRRVGLVRGERRMLVVGLLVIEILG